MKKLLAPAILIVFLGSVYISYFFFNDYQSLGAHIWNLLPPLLASLMALITVRTYGKENPHAKALAFLSLGILFWFLGESIWFIYEYFYNLDPFPSVADLFYLLAYPSLFVGLIYEFRSGKMNWTKTRLFVCISKSFVFAVLVIYFGIIKAYDPQEILTNNLIAMSYGIVDLVLVTLSSSILLISFSYKKGKLFLPWIFIFLGFSLILSADILFAIFEKEYKTLMGFYRNIDLGWITGFSFITFGFYKIRESIEEVKAKLLK